MDRGISFGIEFGMEFCEVPRLRMQTRNYRNLFRIFVIGLINLGKELTLRELILSYWFGLVIEFGVACCAVCYVCKFVVLCCCKIFSLC